MEGPFSTLSFERLYKGQARMWNNFEERTKKAKRKKRDFSCRRIKKWVEDYHKTGSRWWSGRRRRPPPHGRMRKLSTLPVVPVLRSKPSEKVRILTASFFRPNNAHVWPRVFFIFYKNLYMDYFFDCSYNLFIFISIEIFSSILIASSCCSRLDFLFLFSVLVPILLTLKDVICQLGFSFFLLY